MRLALSVFLSVGLIVSAPLVFADPIITEFMASNQNSIEDEDGSRSDWIEIYNPDNAGVNMEGWSLTDNASSPKKWVFPAVVIPPKTYIIVFASDKNRRIVGQPLHTNFALSAGGEYLALIKPDGVTKTTEFAPGFPAQFADISYGVAGALSEQVAIDLGSVLKVKVPANNADGTNWRNKDFNDSTWTSGTSAVGYFNYNGTSAINLSDRLGTDVKAQMGGINQTVYIRIPFTVPNAGQVVSLKLRMNYDDGFAAFVNGASAASSNSPAVGSLTYNSGGTALHSPSEDEGGYQEFDINNVIPQLVNGTNVLAIHGLNTGVSSSDLYMEPQLIVGIDTGEGGEIGYFNAATPGFSNGGPDSIQLPQTITYSRTSGPFTTGFSLSITGAAAGQQIRYVIADPTSSPNANVPEPTMSSTVYSGPIAITSSKVIRAAVFNPNNGQRGAVKTGYFAELETGGANNTSSFTSQLPITVVDNFGGGEFSPGQPYRAAFFSVFQPANGTASLNSVPTLFTRVGQKVRGSSSAHFPKRAMGMKTWSETNQNQKRSILGLAEDSSWIWYNPWKYDDAYIRNAFMFQLSREMGQWASRTQPVEMFMNTNGGKLDYTDYWGVYVLTEKIESGSDRLDIDEMTPSDVSGDNLTGGYIIKYDRADADETSWYTSMSDNNPNDGNTSDEGRLVLVEPEQEDERPEQVTYIKNYIAAFESALQADVVGNFATRNYLKYIDLPSWIDVHILNSFALNPDSFRLSSFFHKPRNGKLKAGPIWDFDRGLGADRDNNLPPDNPRNWNGTHFDMSWWKYALRDPEFIQAWVDRWWELRAPGGPMSDASINANVTAWGNMIGNAAGARDAAKWPGVEGNAPEAGSYLGEIAAFKDWLTSTNPGALGRTNWIDSQVPAPPTANLPSGVVSAGAQVTLSGAETLRYSTGGNDPRPVGGNSGGTAYSGPVTVNQTTVLKARRFKNDFFIPFPHNLLTRWSAPLTRVYLVNEVFATSSDIAISEVHYAPADPTTAERQAVMEVTAGEFEYIELRNVGSRVVNTFEMKLVQGRPANEVKLAPLTLAPGERALIVKNRTAFITRYGNSMASRIVGEWREGQIANEGEEITLLARDGSTIEDFELDPIASGGTSLKKVDGIWKSDVPSPGAAGPTYAQWKSFYFPSGGAGSGNADDIDNDGVTNEAEYSHGTSPTAAENHVQFVPTFAEVNDGTGNNYIFTFKTSADRPSASTQAEKTADFVTWTPVQSTLVSSAQGIETRTVAVSLDSAGPRQFYRVRTTITP